MSFITGPFSQKLCKDHKEAHATLSLLEQFYTGNNEVYVFSYRCNTGYYNTAGAEEGKFDCLQLRNGQLVIQGERPVCVLDYKTIGRCIKVSHDLV